MHVDQSYVIFVHYILHTGLACMQANCHLAKLTASHNGVLITQIANKNMPKMVLIART